MKVSELTQNIVCSLSHLLTAREGHAPAAPVYGVAGGVHGLRTLLCEMPRVKTDIAELMQQAVREGEPRLEDIVVTSKDQKEEIFDQVAFLLQARLKATSELFVVELLLKPSGHVLLASPRVNRK